VTHAARILTSFLLSSTVLAGCAEWPEAPPLSASSAPSASTLPAPDSGTLGDKATTLAKQQLGVPYVFGGYNPRGFDCSGLVYYVYGQLGVSVPRTAEAQFSRMPQVALDSLQPGDLVFFNGDPTGYMHVGIYIGDGWFVHAPGMGKTVSGARLDNVYWKAHYLGAGRPR
jgi:cell wall-associated NlpC family hydrolase